MTFFVGEREAAIADAATGATQYILFDRDETDSFRIKTEAVDPAVEQFTRAQLMRVLPVGSRWSDAVGWESYLVFPPTLLTPPGLAVIGLEYVVPHETRGAYPIFGGAALPVDRVSAALARLATTLDGQGNAYVSATYGVVRSDAQDALGYRGRAAWMLRSAAASFANGRPIHVRTLLLTQDEAPGPSALFDRGRNLLFGTVPALCARFSWTTNQLLTAIERKGRASG